MRVLIIEDNPRLAESLAQSLKETGYVARICHTALEGEDEAASEMYDAIVLDLMLPDANGIDVLRSLRSRGVQTPVLILSALSSTRQKVDCLDAGADDYVTKPLEYDEFVARLRALMRRDSKDRSALLTVGDLSLDLHQRHAVRGGQQIRLSAREYSLLEYLLRNPNRVLERELILEHVWDRSEAPSSNVVDVYVSSLRKKIDRPFDKPLLHTVVGAGYRFGDPGL